MGLVRLTYQCCICGSYGQDPVLSGYCKCGANAWINHARLPPRPPPAHPQPAAVAPAGAAPIASLGPPSPPPASLPVYHRPAAPPANDELISGAQAPAPIVDDFVGSRINDLLGGIRRPSVVLIAGAAGAGKSTAAAELAAAAAHHWSVPEAGDLRDRCSWIYWLDSDQGDPSLIRHCFHTAGAEAIFQNRVRLLPAGRVWSWEEALAKVPEKARVLVVDSLERWGKSNREQLDVIVQSREHPAWLKIVLAGTNKEGGITGLAEIERADDATVYARAVGEGAQREHTLTFTKTRWSPCASAEARRRALAPPPPAEPDAAAPLPLPVARMVRAPLEESSLAPTPPRALNVAARGGEFPDFSEEFLAQAARWSVREIERYRAQLRARPVPPETIKGWDRAVEDERARQTAETDKPDDDEPGFVH